MVGTNRGLYAGHAALILVESEGSGILYSSQFDFKKIGTVARGKWIPFEFYKKELSKIDIETYFKTGRIPLESKNKVANLYLSEYDKYINIPISNPYLGKFMLEKAESIHRHPGLFNLYERNCNHLCQEILASGNLNFTPTRGSQDLVLGQIQNVQNYIKQWKLLEALYYAKEEYRKDLELGMIPNSAYKQGVEWAKAQGYTYGNIGKVKHPIIGLTNPILTQSTSLSLRKSPPSELTL